MHVPGAIRRIVFTIGYYRIDYSAQILSLMSYVHKKFSDANIVYSLHSKYTKELDIFIDKAKSLSFDIALTGYDCNSSNFYEDCDLHIGYRVHGYVAFLRKRRPAILISEDNREVGFGLSFKSKYVFPAFECSSYSSGSKFDSDLIEQLDDFIDDQTRNSFVDYEHIPGLIDATCQEKMMPHIEGKIRSAFARHAQAQKQVFFLAGAKRWAREIVVR